MRLGNPKAVHQGQDVPGIGKGVVIHGIGISRRQASPARIPHQNPPSGCRQIGGNIFKIRRIPRQTMQAKYGKFRGTFGGVIITGMKLKPVLALIIPVFIGLWLRKKHKKASPACAERKLNRFSVLSESLSGPKSNFYKR